MRPAEKRVIEITEFLRDFGPQFGEDLCRHFGFSDVTLYTTVKPMRAAGLLIVDRLVREGGSVQKLNRYTLAPHATDAAISAANALPCNKSRPGIREYNPSDPFGRAGKP